MLTLIKNCRLLSPGIDLEDASVAFEGASIKAVYSAGEPLPDAGQAYDAKGAMAMPGFIDIHSHGAAGYDVMDAKPEGFKSYMEAKLKEGVTTLLPTTICQSEEALAKALRVVADVGMGDKAKGPRIPGVHLEGPFINVKCAGAQNPDFVKLPDIEEVRRLDRIAKVCKISFAAELDGAEEFTAALAGMGIAPSCGHSSAGYGKLKRLMSLGLRQLTHFCNQMSPLHHREVGLVGAGLLEDDLLIEMICDRMHLCEGMIKLAFKVKPAGSVALITDSISGSWMPDGEFSIGGLPAVVSSGAARLKSNGALAGSILRFNHALRNVFEITGLPLCELVRATSLNQAQALGFERLGRIEPGCKADIVVLDDAFEVKKVFVDGVAAL